MRKTTTTLLMTAALSAVAGWRHPAEHPWRLPMQAGCVVRGWAFRAVAAGAGQWLWNQAPLQLSEPRAL